MLCQHPLRVHCAAALFVRHRKELLMFEGLDDLVQVMNDV